MNNLSRTKPELIEEISALKKRIQELERADAEHRQAKEELKSSLQQLRLLIDTGPDFFFLKDLDLRYQLVNLANARFFGCSEAEITGRSDFDLMPYDAATACQQSDRVAIDEKRIVITIESIEGRFYETYKFPVVSEGKIAGVAGIVRDITDRKQVEISLRDTQTRYRLLFEHAPYGIVTVDTATARFLEFNEIAHRQLGYSREEFAELSISDIEVLERPEETRRRIESVIRYGRDDFETIHRTRRGELRNVNVTAQITELAGQTVYHCVWRDITERKRNEEELSRSRTFLSDLIENSGALICVKDRQGRYELVNRKWESVTGLEREATIGRTDLELFPGPTGDRFRENDEEVMESGSVLEKEETLEGGQGKRSFISIKFPLRSHNDAVTGMCAMITEITARKEMEEQLAISRNRLTRAEIISRSGNWEFDMESKGVFASEGARRIYGVSNEDLTIPGIQRMPLPEYRAMLDRALTGLIENGHPYDVEFKIKRPDTGEIVDIHSMAEYDSDRKVVFGIIQDITDRKLLESQLLQAKKLEAIGTLAGGVAHDFNNILMGIQGYASIMMLELGDTRHPDYERLKCIEEQVKSASNLTRQLLGFARAGGYEVKPGDMNEVLRESSAMFHRTKKELTIHGKYEKDLWTVEIDRGQIEQVLLNLYVNAWHAMPAGGELYLETANVVLDGNYAALHDIPRGNYVRVSVADTGMGMEEETMKRIFDPFFTTKEMGRGTGLGLAMVYGIMKGHKGIVDVRSKPGQGTTFTLYFPASKKANLRQERPVTASQALRGSETIFLVDDESTVLRVTKRMLESLGYTVHTKDSGLEAVAFFEQMHKSIDLVILDMIMPRLSGGETFDRIRKLDPSTKVILSSGYSLDSEAQQIMSKGCSGFIQKPYNIATLSRKIREILDKKS